MLANHRKLFILRLLLANCSGGARSSAAARFNGYDSQRSVVGASGHERFALFLLQQGEPRHVGASFVAADDRHLLQVKPPLERAEPRFAGPDSRRAGTVGGAIWP